MELGIPGLEPIFGVVMGVSLASMCGLRAFLPLAGVSLLAWTGRLDLHPSFAWLGHPASALCFTTALLAEAVGDKIPAVDHALDAVGVLLKPIAGALVTASFIQDMDPLLALVAGLASGGLVAEGVHLVKAKVRLASSVLTGTLANPLLSLAEDFVALLGVVLSVVVPVLVLVGVGLGGWWMWRRRVARRSGG